MSLLQRMLFLQRIGLIVTAIFLVFAIVAPGYAQDRVGDEAEDAPRFHNYLPVITAGGASAEAEAAPMAEAPDLATESAALALVGDMISTLRNPNLCMTAQGAVSRTPSIQPLACNGSTAQRWQPDAEGRWHNGADSTYCLARRSNGSWELTLRLCTDALTLRLQADAATPDVYAVVGETYLALSEYDTASVGLYNNQSSENQRWRWFQEDLTIVNGQGCRFTFPVKTAETALVQQLLACHRVASVQPPYQTPANAKYVANFPGPVPATAPRISRTVAFDLAFKDHSYLRMSVPPPNWKTMGLYARPHQTVQVTVPNVTAAELQDVYVQVGVHTDRLYPIPTVRDQIWRFPQVALRIKLKPGQNNIRSPYGGPLILVSNRSQNKVLQVTFANAVEAPYFVLGQTTEAEWLARRAAPVPFAEVESARSVLHVPAADVNTLSYAEIQAVAHYFEAIVASHNDLAGLDVNDPDPRHWPAQGQHRHVEDIQISAGGAHSGYPLMYYVGSHLADLTRKAGNAWVLYHELGHNYQMGSWSDAYDGEVTNNLFSLYGQERLLNTSRMVDEDRYPATLAILNDPAIPDKWEKADRLLFFEQIRLAFPQHNWTLWAQLMRRYRNMSDAEYNALETEQQKRDRLLELVCDITNTNVAPHFVVWAVGISASSQAYCATKAPMTQQSWLIDGGLPTHSGTGAGSVTREVWHDLPGELISDLTDHPAYPNNPSQREEWTARLAMPEGMGDNYGQRIRGYLHPPVTGTYRFWAAGDNAVRLRLSTDENPANAATLIEFADYTGKGDFDSHPGSQPLQLTAGRRYYLEVLHKEAGGGDHVEIAWDFVADDGTPGEIRKIIDSRFLSPYAATYQLVSAKSNLCLDVAGNNEADGAAVIQWGCYGEPNQQWTVGLVGNRYRVTAGHSGKALTVQNGGLANGVRIVQSAWLGAAYQQWQVQPAGQVNGVAVYQLSAGHSGKCLQVRGGSMAAGEPLVQRTCSTQIDQKWYLRPITTTTQDTFAVGSASAPGFTDALENRRFYLPLHGASLSLALALSGRGARVGSVGGVGFAGRSAVRSGR